ncbi:hypothetical protein [Hymenobacter sp. CRA2]|uniref:hypothetical protein n=1 Tax=Hymenobacter sp. CRA2 TaxID=1955620 RepID=UPI00098F39D1|nr:hypothetical protein [Hymenobacter sp. CRA2]OON70495.1 hypothetical protein B0919_00215 [Hymenobacter sp. CRA2]
MRIWTRGLLIAALGIATEQGASAQVFEPGYLINSRGDTLRGEVENAFWQDPPTVVRFRSSATAPIVTYHDNHLRALGLTSGRQLRRELLPIDYRATKDINRMQRGLSVLQTPDSVLADVLLDGPASLLSVQVHDVHHFFVKRENTPYLEMTERRYLREVNGALQVADGNNYRAQLFQYFGDCAAAAAATNKAAFTADALADVVQLYNRECSSQREAGRRISAAVRDQAKVVFGPLLGARYNSFRLHTDTPPGLETPTLDGYNLDGRVHGQGGIFLDLVHGGRRMALHAAVFYSRFGGPQRSIASPNGSAQWRGTVDWRGGMATLQVGMRFMRPLGTSWQLLAGTGIEFPAYWEESYVVQFGNALNQARYLTNQVAARSTELLPLGFASTKLPYLEAGVRHQRFTLTLSARRYGKELFFDNTAISRIERASASDAYGVGYDYSGRTFSTTLSVGYQLNADTDAKRK